MHLVQRWLGYLACWLVLFGIVILRSFSDYRKLGRGVFAARFLSVETWSGLAALVRKIRLVCSVTIATLTAITPGTKSFSTAQVGTEGAVIVEIQRRGMLQAIVICMASTRSDGWTQ